MREYQRPQLERDAEHLTALGVHVRRDDFEDADGLAGAFTDSGEDT